MPVEVVRKRVKNFNLKIYPPDGRVRLSAPLQVSADEVREVLAEKLDWILRKRDDMRSRPRSSVARVVDGEIHFVDGRPFRLRVEETRGRPTVVLDEAGGLLTLRIRPNTDRQGRLRVLIGWYRTRLMDRIGYLVEKWEPVVGVEVAEWRIKRMKTRWGSCNAQAKRIWLSLELARYPDECLEYVVVHEMVHLHERGHNARFWSLVETFMPDWRERKDRLRRFAPLPNGWDH